MLRGTVEFFHYSEGEMDLTCNASYGCTFFLFGDNAGEAVGRYRALKDGSHWHEGSNNQCGELTKVDKKGWMGFTDNRDGKLYIQGYCFYATIAEGQKLIIPSGNGKCNVFARGNPPYPGVAYDAKDGATEYHVPAEQGKPCPKGYVPLLDKTECFDNYAKSPIKTDVNDANRVGGCHVGAANPKQGNKKGEVHFNAMLSSEGLAGFRVCKRISNCPAVYTPSNPCEGRTEGW